MHISEYTQIRGTYLRGRSLRRTEAYGLGETLGSEAPGFMFQDATLTTPSLAKCLSDPSAGRGLGYRGEAHTQWSHFPGATITAQFRYCRENAYHQKRQKFVLRAPAAVARMKVGAGQAGASVGQREECMDLGVSC